MLCKEKKKIEMLRNKMVGKKENFCLSSPLNPHHAPGRAEVKWCHVGISSKTREQKMLKAPSLSLLQPLDGGEMVGLRK